jgi:glycosyltransferase involved in cell wall biosynthesis
MLRRLGCSPDEVDLSAVISDRDVLPDLEAISQSAAEPGGLAFLHVNPPELLTSLQFMQLPRSTYRVGCWAWELDSIPPQWAAAGRLVNEIWAPTTFCAAAIARSISAPVHVVPYPIRSMQQTFDLRGELGLDATDFLVLFSYDALSSHARKNPEAAIRAFRMGLAGAADARMILKVNNLKHYPAGEQSLSAAIDGDPRIRILTTTLDEADMHGLIGAADVVISLHRAEGFGLLLARAMLAGKPVVATNWSGNCDFMNEDVAAMVPFELVSVSDPQGMYRNGRWASPAIPAAAQFLRNLYNDKDMRMRIGGAARAHADRFFGPQLDRTYRTRLEALGASRTPATAVGG